MHARAPYNRPASSQLPLALSLVAHGLVLAGLWHFAPRASRAEREVEPVTVRFVPHSSRAEEPIERPRSSDRRALPDEPQFPPVPILPDRLEDLSEESLPFAVEVPASARRSAIGVGSAGMLRVPHPASGQVDGCAAPALALALTALRAPEPVEETTPPAPLDCPPPEYPAGAASVSERGRVRLELWVGIDGRVESVNVLRSSGFARLDEAAQRGVRNWRFHPARRAGVALAWRLEHTIVFRVASGP